MLSNIEKGDTVVVRDPEGNTRNVVVLSVKPDYERPGGFVRFDYIDQNEASPMRRTAYPKELMSIVRKSTVKPLDPKAPRPGDESKGTQQAIVINGKVYVERSTGTGQTVPVNPEASNTAQVHEAVAAPAKPVTSRLKKSK